MPLLLSLSRTAGSALALATLTLGSLPAAQAQKPSLFAAAEVDPGRFVLVAAPIGKGERSQLNIYEQIRDTQACYAVADGRPALVDPLLATFDFTGICSRYIDGNGYSLRIGSADLGTVYRLTVRRGSDDTLLVAAPTKAGVGPEMVVARANGSGSGFLKLDLEPGWRLMRRQFGTRLLGHVYLYSDSWPGSEQAANREDQQPENPTGPTPADELPPLP